MATKKNKKKLEKAPKVSGKGATKSKASKSPLGSKSKKKVQLKASTKGVKDSNKSDSTHITKAVGAKKSTGGKKKHQKLAVKTTPPKTQSQKLAKKALPKTQTKQASVKATKLANQTPLTTTKAPKPPVHSQKPAYSQNNVAIKNQNPFFYKEKLLEHESTENKSPEQKIKYGHLTKEPVKLSVSQLKAKSQQKKKLLKLKQELEYLNKKSEEEDLIKDVEGKSYCRDESCDQPAVTGIYCRYHYLALWKHLQTRKQLLKDNYLLTGIQKIIKSTGPEAWSFLLHDFKNEKNFDLAMKEMNLFVSKEEDSLPSETYES